MTLIGLQRTLGDQIEKVLNDKNEENRQRNLQNAEMISKLAKQMINNADVILRTDKLSGRHDRSDEVVGKATI